MIKCPRCQLEVTELENVDPALAGRLQEMGEVVPSSQVCRICLADLRKISARGSSSGGILLAQERAREQHLGQLWKSRVQLIKQARQLMAGKNYSAAAVAYEKYLKILELVFEVKKGGTLNPDMFKESARTGELTIVASIYWDLLRIYDTHDKYSDRQQIAARQLALFVRFTPIYPDIIKKAEAFQKQAKHPAMIKLFLKGAAAQRPRCFIATSAFENPFAVEVIALQNFRDNRLRSSRLGRRAIYFYYRFSPWAASLLDKAPAMKAPIRGLLRLFLAAIR